MPVEVLVVSYPEMRSMQRNYGSYDGMKDRPEKTVYRWHELYLSFVLPGKR